MTFGDWGRQIAIVLDVVVVARMIKGSHLGLHRGKPTREVCPPISLESTLFDLISTTTSMVLSGGQAPLSLRFVGQERLYARVVEPWHVRDGK